MNREHNNACSWVPFGLMISYIALISVAVQLPAKVQSWLLHHFKSSAADQPRNAHHHWCCCCCWCLVLVLLMPVLISSLASALLVLQQPNACTMLNLRSPLSVLCSAEPFGLTWL